MIQVMTLLVLFGIGGFAGCGNEESRPIASQQTTQEDVQKEVQEAAEAIEQYTDGQFKEYERSLETKLQELDKKQEKLEAQIKKVEKAESSVQEVIMDLKMRKEEVKGKLHNLGKNTGEAWEEMKSSTDKALKDLDQGYDRALEEFSS